MEAAVWHGPLDTAEAILAAHPEIAAHDIHIAALLGNEEAVRKFIAFDPANATAPGCPHGWDALTYLCFSKYLRLDRARTTAFIGAATALLDAGASANTGFWSPGHQPEPTWESALYGAAGVAHHPELTHLLLQNGADPNDEETPYHAPESYDNAALKVLVESGKLTPTSLTTMLLRKADSHDFEGIKYLLEHGADPNRTTAWGVTALQQAIRRDNSLKIIQLMLDHGARHESAAAMAARRGRDDVLEALGCPNETISDAELQANGGKLLAEFAGNDNTEGVRQLLDRGVPVDALYDGDPYFQIPENSTALHVAAWRAAHKTVRLLIEKGAPINAKDGNGRTALELAGKARVDSYWTEKSAPDSIEALQVALAILSTAKVAPAQDTMKIIGLIGGMSWESTIPYYRHINEAVKARRGGLHSAKLILYSVDFQEIAELQQEANWQEAGRILAEAAQSLEKAGAECIVLCTNTMHKVAPAIEQSISIPLLHIADATAESIKREGLKKIALLGTSFTMEQDFYKGRLTNNHGLEVLIPNESDRKEIHRVIYDELCLGKIKDDSRQAYLQIIDRLIGQGAEGIIFGCTEISLLLDPAQLPVPAFDTTKLHALYAESFAATEP